MEELPVSSGEEMIAYALERGDRLPNSVAEKIIGSLAGEIPARLAAEKLDQLLASDSGWPKRSACVRRSCAVRMRACSCPRSAG
jgi:hypothetical protein